MKRKVDYRYYPVQFGHLGGVCYFHDKLGFSKSSRSTTWHLVHPLYYSEASDALEHNFGYHGAIMPHAILPACALN